MSKTTDIVLVTLADQVADLAGKLLEGADRKQREDSLRERKEQVETLRSETQRLIATKERLAVAGVPLKAPKKAVRPRISALENLDKKMTANIDEVLEPTALNQEGLSLALAEAESALLNDWRNSVTPPDATAAVVEGALEMAETADAARQLRNCREQLVAASGRLPDSVDGVKKLMATRREHDSLAEQLAAAGLKPEILVFLQRARSEAGVPLAELLKDDDLLKWLKAKNRAAAFRVKTNAGSLRFSR